MAEAFRDGVSVAGGQSATGRLFECSQHKIHLLIKNGKPCPPEKVLVLETHTGISRHVLRPDIYGLEVPAAVRTAAGGGPDSPSLTRPSDRQLGEVV